MGINITGNGSIIFDGDEYGKGSTLKFAAYSEPVLEIKPAENWKIYNVTVGTNGSAIPYGTSDKIQLPALENYATVNVIFTEAPAGENAGETRVSEEIKPEKNSSDSAREDTSQHPSAEAGEAFHPEKRPENLVEIAVNITGEGSVLFGEKEYKNKDTLSLPEYSSPEFLIQPADNWKVYNVTVGSNGSATPCGNADTIKIDALSSFSTINVIFAEMKPEEIEAGKDLPDDSKEDPAPEEPEGETEAPLTAGLTENQLMHYTVRPKFTGANEPNYEIIVTIHGNGKAVLEGNAISSSYTVKKISGSFFTLTFEPGVNSKVDKVIINLEKSDEENLGEISSYTDKNVSKNYNIDVYFEDCLTYEVKFDYQDGKTSTRTVNAETNKKLSFETPKRIGYNFKGWLCEDDKKVYPESGDYIVRKSVTFKAQWELATYTLTYEPNGGDKLDSVKFTIKDTVALVTPSQTGKKFVGWHLSSELSDAIITSLVGEDHPENITVYAEWTPKKYNVVYIYNDGKTPDNILNDIEHGSSITLPGAKREGYEFIGWKCNLDGKTYKAEQSYPVLENTEFTAQWKKLYKVAYVYNDNKSPSVSQNVPEGNVLTLPSRTRSGYDFKGWKCSADGKVYQAYTQYPVKSDVTFTAQWEKQKVYYKVSVYHTNNGAVYYNGQPLASGSSFELEEGETAELKFAATASGYYVYNCTVNNVRRGSVEGLTVGPMKENLIISVTFAPTFVRPITGDRNHPILWACLMAVSALGFAGVPALRKKRRAEK